MVGPIRRRAYGTSWQGRLRAAVGFAKNAYGVYSRMAYRNRIGGANAKTKRRMNTNSLTYQRDSKVQYRRKRMPYGRKKRWKGFVKKWRAVAQKAVGQKMVVLNDYLTSTTAVDTQAIFSIVKYGITGTSSFGTNDLSRLATADAASFPVGSKVQFTNAVLDITFTNYGVNTCEFDIYEFYYRTTANYNDVLTLMTALLGTSPNIGAGLSTTTVGMTPFQIPGLGRYIRITKKTKYFIYAGDQITYQSRDNRNRVFTTTEFVTDNTVGEQKAGWTSGIICVQKGIPTSANGAGTSSIAFGATRTYTYSVLATPQSADGVA